MIIRLEQNRYGGITIRAKNERYHRAIRKHMREMNGRQEDGTAYLQGDYELPEWLNLSKVEKSMLWNWGISKRVDSWEALHLWGWDAHTLAERGIIR